MRTALDLAMLVTKFSPESAIPSWRPGSFYPAIKLTVCFWREQTAMLYYRAPDWWYYLGDDPPSYPHNPGQPMAAGWAEQIIMFELDRRGFNVEGESCVCI